MSKKRNNYVEEKEEKKILKEQKNVSENPQNLQLKEK